MAMLLFNQTSNQVSLNEDVLKTAYKKYMSAMIHLLEKFHQDLEDARSIPKERLHEVFTDRARVKFKIAVHALDNITREVQKILESGNAIEGTNKLFAAILTESVTTNQPQYHLEAIMDLLGKKYVSSGKKDPADEFKAAEILNRLSKAMTMSDSTSFSKVAARGATIADIKLIQDEMKEFQTMLLKTVGVLFTEPLELNDANQPVHVLQ